MNPLPFALVLLLALPCPGRLIEVAGDDDLRTRLRTLSAGDTLRLAPGNYRPGIQLSGLMGTARAPIVIEGADPEDPPTFADGRIGLHFSDCAHLTLRHLRITRQQHGGLNIDDGGDYDTPSHHIRIENLQVSRIGPNGNLDAIKLSGVDDFSVVNCTIEGWGGQAIDMVGCHRGVIESCTFRGRDGYSQHTGPQTKGGSEDIVIRHCRFLHAGGRPLQLGGSTGKPYFRPGGAGYEARRIIAHDNLIVGGLCAVAFAGLDGGEFHHNTIVQPGKWVLRILQENTDPALPRCGRVRFHHNLVVFQRSRVGLAVNVGPHTEPESFTFERNAWFATDAPGRSEPRLPSRPDGSVHGKDPEIDPDTGRPGAPWARAFGRRPE